MKTLILLSLFILASCGSVLSGKPREGRTLYSYNDIAGKFGLVREHRLLKNKLISRTQITNSGKVLEKSVLASETGSVKQNNKRIMVLRPVASEFSVWLEGKKYFSKTKLNAKNKSLNIQYDSPETGVKSENVSFPKGRYFCYYSQIPDCLYHNTLLTQAYNSKAVSEFFVIWESFPFTQEQFSHIGKNLFSKASIKYEGLDKNLLRFIVEVEGQIILYHFSKSFDLVKISWIAQGITVLPAGEDISSLDDE